MFDIRSAPSSVLQLIAAIIMLSLLMGAGSCDLDIGNVNFDKTIDMSGIGPDWGKIESIGSFDKHDVVSYGDGTMGLAGDMVTQLTRDDDGSIEKSRKTSMLSYGSKLLDINDISSFTARDDQGHEYTTGFEKSVTLKNFEDPFILIKKRSRKDTQ